MRRAIRIAGAIFAAVVAAVALAIGGAVLWASTDTDHSLVARLLPRLTGGELVVHRVTGNLLASPRFDTAEVRDAQGTWAVVHDLRIDWSPLRLLRRDAQLALFSAAGIDVLRRPVFAASGSSSWHGFRLDIDRLAVGRLVLAPPVIGAGAALAAGGSLHMAGPDQGKVALALTALDAAGAYSATADFSPARIDATLAANEPPHGLIAAVAHVPGIGPLGIDAAIAGPRSAEAMQLRVRAGKLAAAAYGNVDLEHRTLALDVTANAPAMAPRPDVSWRSVALEAHVHGSFTAPDAAGTLRIAGLAASGATIRELDADVSGNAGQVALRARAEDVRLPGPHPNLLAAAPVLLTADARLDAKDRPVTFTLSHPLLTASGRADTAGAIRGRVAVKIPALAPLAGLAALDVQGHAGFDASFAISEAARRLDLNGTLAITGGQPQAAALIGPDGRIGLSATLAGNTLTVSRLHVSGRAMRADGNGTVGLGSGHVDLAWQATLDDLRAAAPTLSGRLAANGRVQGPETDLSVTADASGEVGGRGFPPGPVRFQVALTGLPSAPTGHVTGQGVLDRAPLQLAVNLTRSPAGAVRVVIDRAAWKSARADGMLTLTPQATLPQGRIVVRIARLDDLRPFVGTPIAGAVNAAVDLTGTTARLRATLRGLALPGTAAVASADLDGSVAGLMAHPLVDARLTATGLRAGAISGSAKVAVRGPADRLGVQLTATLNGLGAPAAITGAATVNAAAKTATLATLRASWKGATLHLLAPARVAFGATQSVQHLRIGVDGAVLETDGRIAPVLDLQLTATNVMAALARLDPSLHARGSLSAEARLRGSLARPLGTVRIAGSGLRDARGPGLALPPADLSATATLDGRLAHIAARASAGSATRLALTGSAALAPAGNLDLHATGSADLAMLNALTGARGVLLRGRLALNGSIAGSLRAPVVGGTAQLSGGDVQDFAQGAHLADIHATIQGEGRTLRLTRFSARAGQGTIGASGTVGVLAPGIPVALNVTMIDARPLAGNLVTATLDANIALTGQAEGRLSAAGNIRIRKAEINVPEHMPQSVAVLPVRIAGEQAAPPPRAASDPDVALDLNLAAARRIYVRGRGLNVELGGALHLAGTAAKPRPSGAFHMIRGQYSVAGTTLNFSEGDITFTGHANVAGGNRIDPALHFVATSANANVTATLTVGGFASDPKITLSSVPQLPQDEVLAQLLFGQSIKNLSPFQIAEIGSTLAQISGVGSVGIGDPLNRLRNALGLDRLTIGTNPVNPAVTPGTQQNNANTVMQAGRYVAPGVYLGARQGIVGGSEQTEATVQIDLTKHLKLQTGAGSGQGANNLGLTYQFQY